MYAVDGHVVVKARSGYRKYYLARVRKMGGGQQVLWREWETASEAEAYGRRWVRRWEELHTPPTPPPAPPHLESANGEGSETKGEN